MNEKQPIKISLSTFLLVIAIIAIIILVSYIYYSNKKITELDSIATNLQTTINQLEEENTSNLNTTITEEETSNNNNITTNEKEESSTDEQTTNKPNDNTQELKNATQKYFDLRDTLSSNTFGILDELGLKTSSNDPSDYDGFYNDKPYTDSYFIKTDISYSDFKEEISKYMTFDFFNNQYPDYVINRDGFLCLYSEGGTGIASTIEDFKISDNSSDTYTCDVTIETHYDDDGRNLEEDYTITLIRDGNRYVVSNCK